MSSFPFILVTIKWCISFFSVVQGLISDHNPPVCGLLCIWDHRGYHHSRLVDLDGVLLMFFCLDWHLTEILSFYASQMAGIPSCATMPSQLPAFCWLFLIFSFLFFAIMVLQ
jgi:hypothetical protein